MAAAKSDKETRLNSTIQPLAKEIFVANPSLVICEANVSHVFICLKPLLIPAEISNVYYAFDTP
jgi:hypothetical protein